MGVWGVGAFDNDDAADWGGDLSDGGSAETVRSALEAAARCSPDEYLEVGEGTHALAAGEVVAAAGGRPTRSDAYSEAPLAWAARHPEVGTPDFARLALAAIERIRAGESELPELWDEPESTAGWEAAVEELRARLALVAAQ